MRSNGKKNIMPDAIGYIDDDIVSGVLGKIDKKNNAARRPRRRNALLLASAALALAACALLLALVIPTTKTIVREFDIFQPAGAGDSSGHVEKLPEYDGSRGLLYEINENGTSASFIGYGSCTDETVYIASTYDGLPVTVMYNKDYLNPTFVPYNQNKAKNVKHIVISDTVKYVDSNCISQCPYIESVYFGASVENITSFSFNVGYGAKFSKVEVSPDNPNYSGKGNCIVDLRTKALVFGTSKAVIPDDGSVEIIGVHAFDPAGYRLYSIVIPEGVKIIDRDAFANCVNLESVILPDSLEVIESGAFERCKMLTKLELGTNLKAIDAMTFYGIRPPEVFYKGTVEQWEAVIKTNTVTRRVASFFIIDGEIKTASESNTEYVQEHFTVVCTDGESNSEAGKTGNYNWRYFPEYREYFNQEKANVTYYVVGPHDTVTKVRPWEKYGQE